MAVEKSIFSWDTQSLMLPDPDMQYIAKVRLRNSAAFLGGGGVAWIPSGQYGWVMRETRDYFFVDWEKVPLIRRSDVNGWRIKKDEVDVIKRFPRIQAFDISLNLKDKKVVYDKTKSGEDITRYYDREGELHREDGPAVEWPNGSGYYYIHGKRLSPAEWEAYQTVRKKHAWDTRGLELMPVSYETILRREGFEVAFEVSEENSEYTAPYGDLGLIEKFGMAWKVIWESQDTNVPMQAERLHGPNALVKIFADFMPVKAISNASRQLECAVWGVDVGGNEDMLVSKFFDGHDIVSVFRFLRRVQIFLDIHLDVNGSLEDISKAFEDYFDA